ncbi:MAG: efflux RND transporter permease subunit [Alphaproteobacteria bacterium]|nr:efflux RND transporter permease subunit [Alphaproteobacteria bacterium]
MSLPELCIHRPVMTSLLMVAITLFGGIAYFSLPVSELPNVDFPTISVTARLPGASPETMASSVATPLEKQFSTIDGIDSMTSSSSLGTTRITIQFALSKKIDVAAQDVQSAIGTAQRLLPADMPSPPNYRKVNPANSSIYYMALSSPTLPLSTVDEYAQTNLAQRISMVQGVAQVQVFGTQKYAVRVQVDPDSLAMRNIGIDELRQAISKSNVNLPVGSFEGPDKSVTIQSTGQLFDASAYARQIVAYRNGAPVRLGELGRVVNGVENNKVASWFNNSRAVVLAVQRQPGTNTIEVVDGIKALIPVFRQQLPASVDLDVIYDRTESIRASIHDVQFTLVLAAVLVVLVIFLFLRNLSATVIPSLALPISVIGTFAVMYLLGFSLDNLSLMALTLSVGFVVDDAIVMLENIVRYVEKGLTAWEAAKRGAREIGFTIISMTLSLAAVFIPVMFMGGIVGRLLNQFAITVCAAIFVSGFVSLTLTPMLCSRFIKPEHGRRHGVVYMAVERTFDGMRDLYGRSLAWSMARPRLVLASFLLTIAAKAYLYVVVPKDFIPSADIGSIIASTEGAQDTSFESMVRHQRQVAAIVLADPNVDGLMSSVGAGGPRTAGNSGTLVIRLKPRSERKLSADEVIGQLRRKVGRVAGIKVFLQNRPVIRVGGRLSKAEYQYTLQSLDLEELYRTADGMQRALAREQGFRDVTSDMDIRSPQLIVEIDRNRAATLGLSADQIEGALASAYGSQRVTTIYTPSNQYEVILEVAPRFQHDPSALSHLYLRSTNGALVPLTAVVMTRRGVGPLTVNHQGQLPAVTISFNLDRGMTLGAAVDGIERLKRQLKVPGSVTASFQGTAQAFRASFAGLGILLILAMLVVYLVLGILYESFVHPLTILSGLPSAGLGALLTLIVFDQTLNLYSFVGVIMLIGIVKKNAIMMIDFALSYRRDQGSTAHEAIYQACLVRFRPIMMTTMAALAGTMPIAVGYGDGGEARAPLGLAVVGGLLVSQFITLYLTPVVFVYLDKVQDRLWGGVPQPAAVAAGE